MASTSDSTPDQPAVSSARKPPDFGAALPNTGRLLGIDFGTKRIGYAVSDPAQTMSSPLESWSLGDARQDERRLKTHVAEYRVVGVVVGLPVHMSGDESGKSGQARRFGAWVTRITGLPVAYWDERYSSAMADEMLRSGDFSKKGRDKRRDMLAAQILLQRYLAAPDRSAPPADMSTGDTGPVR